MVRGKNCNFRAHRDGFFRTIRENEGNCGGKLHVLPEGIAYRMSMGVYEGIVPRGNVSVGTGKV